MRTLSSIEELPFATAARTAPVVGQRTSDHALLEGTLAGDEDAFAELVARYRNQITSYIYRMTSDYDGAVDLAQETFLKAWRAWPPASQENLSGWLCQIATRTALDALRRDRLVSWQPLDGQAFQLVHPTADPQTRYDGPADIHDAALSHLPAQARRLLRLAADSTARELAQTLGVKHRTLASHLSRLKAQARQLYQEEAHHG